jgi:acyl-coenzyme A synthetase/AMP-(fatty) acid ligase
MWGSPLEVEDSLLTHEAVQDAADIPRKSESDGLTYPKAFVVLSPGWALNDALITELQQ